MKKIVALVYRPPDCSYLKFKEVTQKIAECFDKYDEHKKLLCGDFNFPRHIVEWETCELGCIPKISVGRSEGNLQDQRAAFQQLHEICIENGMEQIVDENTRGNNILDLIFTNEPECINKSKVQELPSISDHRAVISDVSWGGDHKKITEWQDQKPLIAKLNTKLVNWENVNNELGNMDWEYIFEECQHVHNMKESIIQELTNTLIRNGATERKQNQVRNKMPLKRRRLFRKKGKIENKLANSLGRDMKERLRILEKINKEIKKSYIQENEMAENKVLAEIKSNPKAFFKFANSKRKMKSNIGPLMKKDNLITENSQDMANILSQQYESVFNKASNSSTINDVRTFFMETEGNPDFLNDLSISKEDVEKVLNGLPSFSAAGPDGVSSSILKTASKGLSLPLAMLYRRSLDLGEPLEKIYNAAVSPIYKGGAKHEPKNYRPVSLTSHIVKTFERLMRKSLVQHLEEKELLNEGQHGFRSNRSTLTQLLEYYETIMEMSEAHTIVDAIYLDYAKAFDKVPHAILMRKLKEKAKIGGKIGIWINEFLTNRTQFVVVNGEKSESSTVESGVPQGTVLGPILFIIMISDIDENITNNLSMYADDTRLYGKVRSLEEANKLQEDLDQVYNWAEKNGMQFNTEKFELMRYGKMEPLKEQTSYRTPSGGLIQEKDNLRDLGIIMSNSLRFDEHIERMVAKANQMTGWILRSFRTRQPEAMMLLFKQLVRSSLEYCCPLWSPNEEDLKQKIEKVQRNFTRKISGLTGDNRPNYWERLKILNLYSLERRRERYLILYMVKAITGLVPNLGFVVKRNERTGPKIEVPMVTKGSGIVTPKMKERTLKIQGPKLFNALPKEIRCMAERVSIETFKRELDIFIKTIPDEPTVYGMSRGANSNSLVDQIAMMCHHF